VFWVNIDIHTELLTFQLLQPPHLSPNPPFSLSSSSRPGRHSAPCLRGWILESSPWKAQTLDHSANIARRTAVSVLPTAAAASSQKLILLLQHSALWHRPPFLFLPLFLSLSIIQDCIELFYFPLRGVDLAVVLATILREKLALPARIRPGAAALPPPAASDIHCLSISSS
jgi:hypothetical protein